MEKPILPKPIPLEEYRKRKQQKEHIENLNKKTITEITQLIQEGKISDLEITDLKQFNDDERYLLQLLKIEIDEAQYQKENTDHLSLHANRLEEYIEFLQEEIKGLTKDAIEREKAIE